MHMRSRVGFSLLAAAVLVAACSDQPTEAPRPLGAPGANAAQAGRFIITIDYNDDTRGVARDHGVAPDFVYTHAMNGFAGEISEAARNGLMRDARVRAIEPDGIAEAWGVQSPTPSWGLDRIDARSGLNNSYSYTSTGTGVKVYIIDTGIQTSHSDFGGRASVGFDAIGDGRNGIDCDGHGTHVAGTVGGTSYGVAKGVTLVAVRVLNCSGSGSWSGVIAGMDWVVANKSGPSVANLSLGGGASSAVDAAVNRMINAGVAVAVAAGNGNPGGVAQDACKYSPARVPNAMTISATNNTDTKASWANYGNRVDWFAPGVSIVSDYLSGGTATMSGTSMASPHTAGVAAQYLALNPSSTPAQVTAALAANTTKNVVKSSKTTNAHLLFTNY